MVLDVVKMLINRINGMKRHSQYFMLPSLKSLGICQYRIGKMYAAGLGAEQDYVKAGSWLTQSASEKYKYAEYSLPTFIIGERCGTRLPNRL